MASQIDKAYINSPDSLIKTAEANIHERQTLLEAEATAKQAAEESKSADEKVKKLKSKTGTKRKRAK